MLDWLREKLARWGWIAFECTRRSRWINAGRFRYVHVQYTYNGDVKISVSNTTPHKLIAQLEVSYPDQNNIKFTNFLECEESMEPLVPLAEEKTT